jgi:hypothetical protein
VARHSVTNNRVMRDFLREAIACVEYEARCEKAAVEALQAGKKVRTGKFWEPVLYVDGEVVRPSVPSARL